MNFSSWVLLTFPAFITPGWLVRKVGNNFVLLLFSHNPSPAPQSKSITFERIMKNCFSFVESELKQILFLKPGPET